MYIKSLVFVVAEIATFIRAGKARLTVLFVLIKNVLILTYKYTLWGLLRLFCLYRVSPMMNDHLSYRMIDNQLLITLLSQNGF